MQSPHHPDDRPPTTITWTADHQHRQRDYHLDPKTGLSRYRPDGVGIPPETEATHFTHVWSPMRLSMASLSTNSVRSTMTVPLKNRNSMSTSSMTVPSANLVMIRHTISRSAVQTSGRLTCKRSYTSTKSISELQRRQRPPALTYVVFFCI